MTVLKKTGTSGYTRASAEMLYNRIVSEDKDKGIRRKVEIVSDERGGYRIVITDLD